MSDTDPATTEPEAAPADAPDAAPEGAPEPDAASAPDAVPEATEPADDETAEPDALVGAAGPQPDVEEGDLIPAGAIPPGGGLPSTGDLLGDRREADGTAAADPALATADAPEPEAVEPVEEPAAEADGHPEPSPVNVGVVQDNVSVPGQQSTHTREGTSTHVDGVSSVIDTTAVDNEEPATGEDTPNPDAAPTE